MKNRTFLYGALYGVISWVVFIIADAIDEYILDTGTALGAVVFFLLPIFAYIKYVHHVLTKKPAGKTLLRWHLGLTVAFMPIWGILQVGACRNPDPWWFPVQQFTRGDFLDLNGIEYLFYGFTVLVIFFILCAIFHAILHVVHKLKQKKNTDQ